MSYLLENCKAKGLQCVKAEVHSLTDVFSGEREDILGVVNCSGIGSIGLVQDEDLSPTKGQAVVVRGEASRIVTGVGDDWETVVVPRRGLNETFLGVTKVPHDM